MISKSIVLSVAIPLWCIFIINFANIENVLIRRVWIFRFGSRFYLILWLSPFVFCLLLDHLNSSLARVNHLGPISSLGVTCNISLCSINNPTSSHMSIWVNDRSVYFRFSQTTGWRCFSVDSLQRKCSLWNNLENFWILITFELFIQIDSNLPQLLIFTHTIDFLLKLSLKIWVGNHVGNWWMNFL